MPRVHAIMDTCPLTISLDTYSGCAHGCGYCFAGRKSSQKNVSPMDKRESLKRFIEGKRDEATAFIDWPIPIHWGGGSDPFQPLEKTARASYDVLKIFAETKYPFVVSTKGTLPATPEYLELFKECNFVYQCSVVSPTMCRKTEPGAPTFEERLETVRKIAPYAKRTIIRCQPYIKELHAEIKEQLPRYKDAGVYGVNFENLFLPRGKGRSGYVFVCGSETEPLRVLEPLFRDMRDAVHEQGMVFLCSENRLKRLSDSIVCCGCEGLPGFDGNHAITAAYFWDKKYFAFRESQLAPGSALAFGVKLQSAGTNQALSQMTYKEAFEMICNTPYSKTTNGVKGFTR